MKFGGEGTDKKNEGSGFGFTLLPVSKYCVLHRTRIKNEQIENFLLLFLNEVKRNMNLRYSKNEEQNNHNHNKLERSKNKKNGY